MRQRTVGILALTALAIAIGALCYFHRSSYVETLLLWLIIFIPSLFFIQVHSQYRSILHGKRNEVISIMNRGNTFSNYLKAFESVGHRKGESLERTLEGIFYRKYGRSRYYFPLWVNAILSGLFFLIVLVWVKAPMRIPADLSDTVRRLPLATIAGLAGAFIWGLYDVLRRFETVDLSPEALHSIWLRMLTASIIAPMASAPFTESLRPTVAFAIGLFPTKEVLDFVKGQARKQMGMTLSAQPAEPPTLHKLQGLSEGMIDRLLSEDIESAYQLATADPVKLLLNTNVEWKTILDLIDEAILFSYFDEGISSLRFFGIRGAIELASIQERLDGDDSMVRQQAEDLINSIATALGRPVPAIRNAVRNAYEDITVDFLWNLWGDIGPEDDEDGDEAAEEAEADSSGRAADPTVSHPAHAS